MFKQRVSFFYAAVLFALALMISCTILPIPVSNPIMSEATAAFRYGNYVRAFAKCAEVLERQPDNAKASLCIPQYYTAAVASLEDSVKTFEGSSEQFRWEKAVAVYNRLLDINSRVGTLTDTVYKNTGKKLVFEIKDYTKAITKAQENAADMYYKAGCNLADESSDPAIQRKAALQFKRTGNFVPDYKDAQVRYEQCRNAGVIRIAILPFLNQSSEDIEKYRAVSDSIMDYVSSAVLGDTAVAEFIYLIPRESLDSILQIQESQNDIDENTLIELSRTLGVHKIVSGTITGFQYTPPQISQLFSTEEAKIAEVGEKHWQTDWSNQTQIAGMPKGMKAGRQVYKANVTYKDVTAEVTYFTKSALAVINGSYKVFDVHNARVLKIESFDAVNEFNCSWISFDGDERALSQKGQMLVSHKEEDAPTEEVMMFNAAKDLSYKIAGAIIKLID